MSSETRTFYSRWASVYDRLARTTPGIARLRRHAVNALSLTDGDVVVDVGCGTGATLPILRDRVGPSGLVIGVDFTPDMVRHAAGLIDRHGWDNVHVVIADGNYLPLPASIGAASDEEPSLSIDAIMASFVVGMSNAPDQLVTEWCDHVADRGRVGLLNAVRSEQLSGIPANAMLEVITRLSTPPTMRFRYERDLSKLLTERVRLATVELVDHGTVVVDERYLFGIVRLSVAEIEEASPTANRDHSGETRL